MSKSKIVKAPFVSMSEIRKEITTVDPKDPKIIKGVAMEDQASDEDLNPITEEDKQEEAIDDNVIDGSTSMLLENAKEEAELIIREAQAMAEGIKAKAKEEGYDEGYGHGIQAVKDELEAGQKALEEEAKALMAAYDEKLREAEPEMAKIIAELVNGMVGHYAKNPDVIIFLIKLALSEVTTFGNFMLKVSPEDFEYVMAHRDELTEGLSNRVSVEVLKDPRLDPMDCLIETDYGNIDGSLSLRLDSLNKELKLIADSMHKIREA